MVTLRLRAAAVSALGVSLTLVAVAPATAAPTPARPAPSAPPSTGLTTGNAAAGQATGITGLSGVTSTADGSEVLAPLGAGSLALGTPTLGSLLPAAVVDPTTTYQTVQGFGAALTDSSAWLLSRLPPVQRDAEMADLFGPGGAGLSVLRVPVGASDFALTPYTYDDLPAGATDPTLAHFSIAHDTAYVLPLLREAEADDPALTVVASAWSPPAWMKSGGSLDGGSLLPADYGVYAAYLVRFLQAYAAAGVPVAAITPQNEPETSSSTYPSTTMSESQEAAFVGGYLGPAIARAGLPTKILGYDHNWDDPAFPTALLADPTAGPYVAGTAFHCYAGDPSAQLAVHAAAPAASIAVTECSGGGWAPDYGADLDWDASTLMIDSIRDWASEVLTWNLALDPAGGPQSGGCTDCRGVVTLDPVSGAVTRNVEYAILGQLTRAAPPGSVRVASSDPVGTDVSTVAFRTPSGGLTLFAENGGMLPATFVVRDAHGAFTATLPAGAVATYAWTD